MITDTDQQIKDCFTSRACLVKVPQLSKVVTPSGPTRHLPYCLTVPSWRLWIANVSYRTFSCFNQRQLEKIVKLCHEYNQSSMTYTVGIRFYDAILNIFIHSNTKLMLESWGRKPESILISFVVSDRYMRDTHSNDKYIQNQCSELGLEHNLLGGGLHFSPDIDPKDVIRQTYEFMHTNSDKFIFQHYEETW